MSMKDTYPEPTEYDLAMRELSENVKYLKEQIVESHRLLTDSIKDVSYEGYLQWKIDRQVWIDQNTGIVKECAK